MRKNSRGAAGSGKVTLGMVAEASGVSPSTVSRILNGTAIVSEEKRAAVDRAIAELGFVPNPIARGLAGGRTMSVGVITQVIDSPFYGVALRGIEEELDPLGYSPLFVSGHWDAEHEKRCIETIQDGAPSTEFMKFGDTIRIEMKGLDGRSLFGAIDQEVVAPGTRARAAQDAPAPAVDAGTESGTGSDANSDTASQDS